MRLNGMQLRRVQTGRGDPRGQLQVHPLAEAAGLHQVVGVIVVAAGQEGEHHADPFLIGGLMLHRFHPEGTALVEFLLLRLGEHRQ
ncbi:hypothetical protein D3C75_1270720 [compost metagenome]